MLIDKTGCPDGIHSMLYAAGAVVEVPEDLGSVFVREGWAELFIDEAQVLVYVDSDMEARATKVVQPMATKPKKAQRRKGKRR